MKYYFIVYGASEKRLCNMLIAENPLTRQAYQNRVHHGQHVLITWNKIAQEEYDEYFVDIN
jgi:hypothetical protein